MLMDGFIVFIILCVYDFACKGTKNYCNLHTWSVKRVKKDAEKKDVCLIFIV